MVIINSFKYPESSIRCQQGNVRAVLDNKELGIGTLYVSEHTLCWHQRDNVGLTIDYPNISLHAISNDQTIYPEECVYIMIDGHISMPGDLPTSDEQNDDDSDAESTADISDLILIPECKELITQIYEVIKSCQALNPDPNDMDEDSDNEDDNLYEDAEAEIDYEITQRGGGDADSADISRGIRDDFQDVHINGRNGHEDEEFQDAD